MTITGMRGVGKTRLLEEAKTRLATEGLRVRFVDGATPRTRLERDGAVLVVAAASLLGVPGERELALGLLELPDDDTDPVVIRRSPAVRLLADAARIDLDALTEAALRALAHLARASDGYPPVLEQLAGWLSIASPMEAARLEGSDSLVLVPPALARALRRELRTLDAVARETLGSVAAASAPFELALARAAVRDRSRADVPRALAKLVAEGWLARSGAPDAPRFTVPAPLRAVVSGRNRAGARHRITAFLARRALPILERSVADRIRVGELLAARAELVAAWEDAHERKDRVELALAAALSSAATSGDRDVRGHAARILASIEAHPRAPRRARLEIALGDAQWFSGSPTEADASFEAAIRRARSRRDPSTEAFGWIRRATLGPELGRLDVAHAQLAEARKLLPRSDEPLLETLAVGIRGFVLRAQGDLEGALSAFDAQRDLAQRAGDVFYAANADASAADCHLALGRHALGRMHYERAFRAIKNIDSSWASTLQGYMGLAAWEVGALADAVSHCRRALAGPVGPRFRGIFGAAHTGILAELGETARAATALARAEASARETSAPVAHEAIRAATLLVAHAGASDAASLSVVTKQIASYLRARKLAAGEDERAFLRALERAVRPPRGGKSAPPRLDLDGHPRLAHFADVLRARCADGRTVSAHDLFRAAWPETTDVDRDTAEARVRKAISLLRARGLRGRILTKSGGYALSETFG